ncbi:MAG TPA: aminotransferase class V-fold PLP-dependent enzyme [Terriglobales bacterium]|nr:aminotransferase class V-fold PLP-dependent enzyme [Terriglobales bacterium]
MLHRRDFLHATLGAGGLAAAGLFPSTLEPQTALAQVASCAPGVKPKLPDPALYSRDADAYWAEIRRQFLIPEDMVYLNNGTVGSSPWPVLEAVFASYFDCEKLGWDDPEDYPIWGYAPWNQYRDPLARFVGATRDEIALVRNATEANSFMANGLDLNPGDEVILSDQEHPSGNGPWDLRARRYGIVIKRISIPKPLESPATVLNLINDAITPRTRVIFVSHVTTVTGVILPVRDICSLARSKGIVSMVDGAQVPGMMRLNIREIGCDMYGASPHKWLQAPKGCGFLYVRDEIIDRVWSTVTTHGWDDRQMRAERFQHIGSSNVPILAGFKAAIDFANQIGMERIEKRHRELNDYILTEMLKRGADLWTARDHASRCAIVSVNVPPVQIMDIEKTLWKEKKIRIRGAEPSKIRLCTPYYLQKKDIDRFLAAYDEYKRSYTPSRAPS